MTGACISKCAVEHRSRNESAPHKHHDDLSSVPAGWVIRLGPTGVCRQRPAGSYDAVLIGDGLALPEPQPVPVTLTKGSD